MRRFDDMIIKILSLGLGLAIGIVLIAKVCFELSFDGIYEDSDRIYGIRTHYFLPGDEGEGRNFSNISGAVAPGFKAEVPGVEEATRITGMFDNPHYVDEDGNVVDADMRLADSCFFKVFYRPVLAGNLEKALAETYTVVVSHTFAEKLGGVEECMNKIIYNEDLPEVKLQIKGVYENFPENSSFYGLDLLLSMETYSRVSTQNWLGNDRYYGWVKLKENVDPATLSDAIRKMQEAHQSIEEIERNGTRLWYTLSRFSDVHTSYEYVRTTIIILSLVAALLIVISVLNYILVVISSMVKRSREVGVRKCYGATTADIYAMLTKEAVLHLVLSLALAAVIIYASKGIISNLLDVSVASLFGPQSIAVICTVVVLILAISIAVPGRLYTRLPVYVALKNFTDRSRRWKLGLLGVQVLINVFLMIMMFVIGGQYRVLMNDNPGYDTGNLLHFRVNPHEHSSQMRIYDALKAIPEIEGVEAAFGLPFGGSNGDNIYDENGNDLFNVADNYEATAGFYDMLDIPFIDGRAPQTAAECAVDEAFVEKINEFYDWSDGVVGKTINITGHDIPSYTISGVYRRILTGNRLDFDERPGVRFYADIQDSTSYLPYMLVKVSHLDSDIIEKVSNIIAEAQDGKPANVNVYGETLRSAYGSSLKMRNTLLAGVVFSMLIALMGLIGFVRNETLRRSKEMAIRKINGAVMEDILKLFMLSIMRLSIYMAIAACIAAFFTADKWLEQFAVKTSLSPLYFVGGVAAVMVVEIAVVLTSCWRIAVSNPVDSLKNE